MDDVKWIKVVTDLFNDEKIVIIRSMPDGDSIVLMWIQMLCMAGKQNNSGVLTLNGMPYTDEMLATLFGKSLTFLKVALNTFEQFGMINRINGAITIPKWEKYQAVDKLDAIREQTRARVAKHREHQKLIASGESVTGSVTGSVTVTQCNATELELDKELDKDVVVVEEPQHPQITIQAYVANSLVRPLSGKAMEELNDFLNDMDEDVVRYATDIVSDANKATWSYLRVKLQAYCENGIKTLPQAKKLEADWEKAKKDKHDAQDVPHVRMFK